MTEKEKFFEEFNNGLHRIGRITLILGTLMLIAIPFIIGAINGVMPDLGGFAAGLAKVGVIYIPVAIVEVLVYSPIGCGRKLPVLHHRKRDEYEDSLRDERDGHCRDEGGNAGARDHLYHQRGDQCYCDDAGDRGGSYPFGSPAADLAAGGTHPRV